MVLINLIEVKPTEMNILITGARAPIAIDWGYRLKQTGNVKIMMADSLHWPLGRFSTVIDRYYTVSSPRHATSDYIAQITKIVQQENIQLIIPTCEEIFYLSRYQSQLPNSCHLFSSEFEILSLLHNKWQFSQLIADASMHVPETFYIDSKIQFDEWKRQYPLHDYIAKPVYSRFGSEVVFDLINQADSIRYPAVVQRNITGQVLCSYSIAVAGQVIAHTCYHPKYTAGVGAGMYFAPHHCQQITDFVIEIVQSLHFTGQIGFDFIEQEGVLYVIECNPRATSGLHLMPSNISLVPIILNKKALATQPKNFAMLSACQIKMAMWLYGWGHIRKHGLKTVIKDYKQTRGVYHSLQSGQLHFYQFLGLLEIIKKSVKFGFNLKQAATEDIEWDGQEIA